MTEVVLIVVRVHTESSGEWSRRETGPLGGLLKAYTVVILRHQRSNIISIIISTVLLSFRVVKIL